MSRRRSRVPMSRHTAHTTCLATSMLEPRPLAPWPSQTANLAPFCLEKRLQRSDYCLELMELAPLGLALGLASRALGVASHGATR